MSTPAEVDYAAQYLYFDCSKAQRELGLQPTPIEQTLEASIRWFQERGYARPRGPSRWRR